MKAQIREFIASSLKWTGPAEELADDYPLIENDVVDSMGLFKIVSFLEEHGIEVDDDELVPENFASVDAIAALAARGAATPS